LSYGGKDRPERVERRIELARHFQIAVGHHLRLEIAVGLEHVAHLVRAREAPAPIDVGLDGVVLHRSETEVLRQALTHLLDRQELAGNADGLADVLVAGLEDAERALADVLTRDAGEPGVTHRERPRVLPVVALLRGETEHVQVVPVERGDEQRCRDAREEGIGLGLRVEVRHAILLLQDRHALVVSAHELTRVFESGPNHVLHAGGLGGLGDVPRLRLLLFGGEVLPEVGDAEHAVRAGERLLQALDVVEIRADHLSALRGQGHGVVLVRIARDRADGEAAARVGQDRTCEPAALHAGCAYDCNDLCHVVPLSIEDLVIFDYRFVDDC
jgi:hypothetical protein